MLDTQILLADPAVSLGSLSPHPVLTSAAARPIGKSALLVSMWQRSLGPWSVVCDISSPDYRPLGPPPGYLGLTGWGMSILLHVAGVAARQESRLEDAVVEFIVGEQPKDSGSVVTLERRVVLTGNISSKDYQALQRIVEYCPVSQFYAKRGLLVEDYVELEGAGAGASDSGRSLPTAVDVPAFAPGVVRCQYLWDSQEWLDAKTGRELGNEGEVKTHAHFADGSPTGGHWATVGGHTTAGWGPFPAAYAVASLVASTATTLRLLSPGLGIDPETIDVGAAVFSPPSPQGRRAVQIAAAEGTVQVQQRVIVRKVTVKGLSELASQEAIAGAMKLDPMYRLIAYADFSMTDAVVVN